MKKQKSLICILTAFVLLLAACSNGNETDSTNGGTPVSPADRTGKYVEKDITPDGAGELALIARTADNTLIAYNKDLSIRYESSDDGESWQESAGPLNDGSDHPHLLQASLLDDGSILAEAGPEDHSYSYLVKIKPDGSIEEFIPDGLNMSEAKDIYITHLKVLPDNKVLISAMSGMGAAVTLGNDETGSDDADSDSTGSETDSFVVGDGSSDGANIMEEESAFNYEDIDMTLSVFDLTSGDKLYDLGDSTGISTSACDDNYLYVTDYENNITIINLADGSEYKQLEPDTAGLTDSDDSIIFDMPVIGADGTQNLYNISRSELTRTNIETGITEQLTASNAYAFGKSNAQIQQLLPIDNDTFIVSLLTGPDSQLLKYTFDEKASDKIEHTLNVWALKDNETVRAAIRTFTAAHPDTDVNFETGLSGEGIQDAADAIRTLNTRILAGDGPDVIILDGCPLESYSASGLLMNLHDKIDTSALYDQLATAGENENGTFYVPVRFTLPILARNAEYTEELSNLEQLAEKASAGNDTGDNSISDNAFEPGLAAEDRPVIGFSSVEELFRLAWNTNMHEILSDGTIDTARLETFIASVKQISDKYKLTEENENEIGLYVQTGDGSGGVLEGSLLSLALGNAHTGGLNLSSLSSLITLIQKEGIMYESFQGLTDGSWVPETIAGINAKTEQEDLAAAFIQTLLGDEVQSAQTGGLPVTKAGMDAQTDSLRTEVEEATEDTVYMPDMDTLIAGLKTPVLSDSTLADTILEHITSYCTGETDLKETVENIEQDTKNYLAERES